MPISPPPTNILTGTADDGWAAMHVDKTMSSETQRGLLVSELCNNVTSFCPCKRRLILAISSIRLSNVGSVPRVVNWVTSNSYETGVRGSLKNSVMTGVSLLRVSLQSQPGRKNPKMGKRDIKLQLTDLRCGSQILIFSSRFISVTKLSRSAIRMT